MARQSPEQKHVVARVMHAFKQGQLDQPNGEPVENPKQAIAIALREAGSSNTESPAKNRANLARTRRREPNAGLSKVELLAEARRRKIPGRSRMTKADLEKALG